MQQHDGLGTTNSELRHYFNKVSAARIKHLYPDRDVDLDRLKADYTSGLELAIDKDVPEDKGVTIDHLREMLQLARGDWVVIGTIKALYRRHREIIRQAYDEDSEFKGH